MNSSKRGLASGFRLQSLDLVSLKYRALGLLGVTGGTTLKSLFLVLAVGHQIYRPETDVAALHCKRHPGEISRCQQLLL